VRNIFFLTIKIGDLDSKNSSHFTINLKNSYLKIRALIDLGVVFCGHGLDQDFKILNLIVPPNQIIDTVKLYQLPNQRKIGLRFLSFVLLKQDIQAEIHDSVEDAKIALALYHLYLKFQESGTFQKVLTKLYEIGRSYNWKCEDIKEVDFKF
jgi:PAB-dependent poly(A)-specific ribonuclease subunit 2